ncbi:hypothetical protein DID88_010325 [Monilinia fructigena]|uniref:Protein ARV n=1 Tax=Monilinia fructigena TaxID=38457 RepID=A0A395IM92_9HELO|nr:hypothetical protein DID88_010325 [Monilinia fructigena]
MPICIECRYPTSQLYTEYSGGSTGHGVRLTVCKNCGRFCDKYVEHDFVVLFIDLVLIKPQVYRHLLHNTLMREHDQFDPSIVRLGILLLLFDVYLTWARIEKQTSASISIPIETDNTNFLRLAAQTHRFPIHILFNSLRFFNFEFPHFHPVPDLLPVFAFSILRPTPEVHSPELGIYCSPGLILYKIVPYSYGHMGEYDVPAAARSLGWAVVANNVEALKILLDCGYGTAAILATVGAISRWMIGRGILWAVGLDGVDTVGDSGVAADGKALWAVVELGREWGGRLGLG